MRWSPRCKTRPPRSRTARRPSASPGCRATWVNPTVYRQDRDESRHRRLGRYQGGRSTGVEAAGRVAVRADRRREPDAHRASLAEDLPGPSQHPRRGVHGPHAGRASTWPCGTSPASSGTCRSIGCWAGRAAIASASITRRRPARFRRRHLRAQQQPGRHRPHRRRHRRGPARGRAQTAPSCSTPTVPCRRPR